MSILRAPVEPPRGPHARRAGVKNVPSRPPGPIILGALLLLAGSRLDGATIEDHHLKLEAPPGTSQGDFGTAVATWNQRVFVGSSQRNGSTGAVHVFDASDGTLSRTLTPDPVSGGNSFGKSLAVDGDRLLVGAWREQAAYLYALPSLELLRKFEPIQTAPGSRAGWSVALAGDRVIVGDYTGFAGSIQSGAAYLFDATTGTQLRKLGPPSPRDDDRFGWAVAATSGWVAAGSWGEGAPNGPRFTGAVYFFDSRTGDLQRRVPPATTGSSFGISLAGAGDRFLIGASRDDDTTIDGGAVYLGEIDSPLPPVKIVPTDPTTVFFGGSIAVADELAIVGADWTEIDGLRAAGAAFLMDPETGASHACFRASDATPHARFGSAVAVSERYVVVGSPKFDFRAQGTDAVYVYRLAPPLTLNAGELRLNRQTGLLDQVVTVTNTGSTPVEGFRIQVSRLPEGTVLSNATTESGFVIDSEPLQPGQTRRLILEYYAEDRRSPLRPELSIALHDEPPPPPSTGDRFAIDRNLFLADDAFLIEFPSTPGCSYEVQYTDHQGRWVPSPVPVRATTTRVQWIDRGPPRTQSPPPAAGSRLYRVVKTADAE